MKAVCFLFILPLVLAVDWDVRTALDDYIARVEPLYSWSIVAEFDYRATHGVYTYMLNFTSQQWLNDSIHSQPIWWHWLCVNIPDNVRFNDAAFLYIKGGNVRDPDAIPDPERDTEMSLSRNMSRDVGVVTAVVKNVPNQPIRFVADPIQKNRTEDSIIAYTWRIYMETGDPNIILQLPMTKAAIKALDTINAMVKTVLPSSDINRFVVSGGSKRGWAAWTVGSTDRRIIGLCPIVLSSLNFVKNLHHHYRMLGGYTWVFQDYYWENLTLYLDEPITQELMYIVDPYEYRERLTMPKYLMAATGDEFFMPDDSHYFLDDLPKPMNLLMVENTNHGMFGAYERLMSSLSTFFLAVLTDYPFPQISWTRNETSTGGSVTLTTNVAPTEITAWSSVSNTSYMRDWRFSSAVGPQILLWFPDPVQQIDASTYMIEYDNEPDGRWRAFFINAKFPGPDGMLFDFTTEVNIIPDVFFYPDCQGTGCYGTLV